MEPTVTSDASSQTALTGWRNRAQAFARRLSQIIGVMVRFGFTFLFINLGLERLLPRGKRGEVSAAAESLEMPERLRLALEELGPTAIKLGQSLATRGDLVPPAYIRELRKLQDAAPTSDPAEIRQVISDELGAEVEELFASFEELPRASASIGQVHYAQLRDGRAVAVKVQRPGVAEAVELDLHIMMRVAKQAERSSTWFADNRIGELVHEFVYSLRQELDYLNEARNTDRLRLNLQDDETAYVPEIIWTLCTRRVLVIEWVNGAKPGEQEQMAAYAVDPAAAARSFAGLMMRQIFRDGYFHGDPHDGNVLFLGGERVAFLDCGNAVAIDRNIREGLVSVLMAALTEDPQEMADHVLNLGVASERTDVQKLANDAGQMLARYAGFNSTSQFSIGEMLDEMLGVAFSNGVRMQPSFAAIARSLIVTEGICLQLDPDFDTRGVAEAEARKAMLDRLRPSRVGQELLRVARSTNRYALLIPRQLSQVLGKMQSGGFRLRISPENLEQPLHRLDLMVNRIAFALVVSAVIISSTNLITSRAGSGELGQWMTGLYLFVGLVLGGWLLFSILRSGRL